MSVNGFDINGTIEKYNYDELDNAPLVRGTGTDSAQVVNTTTPTTASGSSSFAAGSGTVASGASSVAVGGLSIASGNGAFAGGRKASSIDYPTTASGDESFAFGISTRATANRAVAFGQATHASGSRSFAMGNFSEAKGAVSTAIGSYVVAEGDSSFVVGKYNVQDETNGVADNNYAVIVGNGTADNARSNAMTVDWDGNVVAAGKMTVGTAPSANMDVATKAYVDVAAAPEIFWATYDVTTNAEIDAACQAGKVVCCLRNSRVYILAYCVSSTKHTFAATTPTQVWGLHCENNVWSTENRAIGAPSPNLPQPLGTAAIGTSLNFARADHVHENNIFWATYGTTTSAEIEVAYQAGKEILCLHTNGSVLQLANRSSATKHLFGSMYPSGGVYVYLVACENDAWSGYTRTLIATNQASSDTPEPLGVGAAGSSTNYARGDHVHDMPSASDVGAAPAIIEVTVSDAGAVTQALDAGKLYHFTGALTSLTITLNVASGVPAQYHFDFDCGSTAPTVTIPNTITMPSGNTFEASKHYEVDILNNYGVVASWATS